MWLIVIVRLLVPFTLQGSPVNSLFQEADRAMVQMTATLTGNDNYVLPEEESAANYSGFRAEEIVLALEPVSVSEKLTAVLQNLWLVWLTGALLLLIRKITVYQGFVRYVRAGCSEVADIGVLDRLAQYGEQAGVKAPVELYCNSFVSSPLLIGFFRPRIVLPTADLSDSDLRYTILHEILREKAGAEIDLVGIEFGNWSTQLNLMLTGGENSLDMFNSFWYTSVSNLAANGQVMALDDLLQSDGQGILGLYDGMEDYLNCGSVNGTLYGIPCIYAWSSENLYLVRAEDAEAAGIDWSTVTDLDSMTDAMIALKEANPDKYFIPGSTDPYWIPKSIDYLGDTNYLGVLTDPAHSTTIENYYESEYFLDFLEHVKVWKEHNLFSPDPLSNNQPTLMNLLLGVADGTPGYSWDAQVGIQSTSVQNNIEVVGAGITAPLATSGDVTTYMWHISSFCKNPEAAMRVLNVLYTDPEASQIITNGLEGLEYELDENGQMMYPEGKTMGDLGWAAASMAYWPNVTICKTWNYEPENVYDLMRDKNANATKSLALGFQFDSQPV